MSPSTRRETTSPSPWWRSAKSISEEISKGCCCICPSILFSGKLLKPCILHDRAFLQTPEKPLENTNPLKRDHNQGHDFAFWPSPELDKPAGTARSGFLYPPAPDAHGRPRLGLAQHTPAAGAGLAHGLAGRPGPVVRQCPAARQRPAGHGVQRPPVWCVGRAAW